MTALTDERLAAIVDSSFDAIIGKDLNSIITDWNRAAEKMFGYTAEEIVGRSILTLIPESLQSEEDEIIGRIRRGERVDTFETVRIRKDGSLIPVSITVSPIRGRDGKLVGASKIARDISFTKESERRIALLLREVHHRVKNNLQMVVSLIQLQKIEPEAKIELRNRIMAMAAVHEHLHRPGSRGTVELGRYLDDLLHTVNASFGGKVDLVTNFAHTLVDAETATNIGLIANELISNTNKYAYPNRAAGLFTAELVGREGEKARLRIHNDGVPFDASASFNGAGVRLIRNLAASVDPDYYLDGANGLDFIISIPVPAEGLDPVSAALEPMVR